MECRRGLIILQAAKAPTAVVRRPARELLPCPANVCLDEFIAPGRPTSQVRDDFARSA
jgi:hypothetical protein